MSGRVLNTGPFLRASRDFPEDNQTMRMELIKMYNDLANNMNARTLGQFATGGSSVNGESWFLTGNRQQGQRQVYVFTATGNIPHGLNIPNIPSFTRGFGTFTDGTNWYGIIFGSNTAITGQVSFYIDPTNIIVLAGAGAPSISKGLVVIEWIANV